MKKFLLPIFVLFIIFNAQAQNPPKRELRGVWITTHVSLDWPNRTQTPAQQQSALIGILNHNKATGMNAAYFQVRAQSDAMYQSSLEPWSYYLTNNQGTAPSPFYDPMQFGIEETHKRGMEFHAWINPYRAVATVSNSGNTAQYSATHVSRTHPEWMLTVGTVRILNPGLPQVRDHITSVIVDIVKRYDVDGIHFDDYFYPTPTSSIADDATYNADPRGFPATTAGRADWRRDNINMLIKRVSDSINVLKPWVKFGVSPSGIYMSAANSPIGSNTSAGALQHYKDYFADTRKWIQSGWVDYLVPQIYWYRGQSGSDYNILVPWWNNNAFGRHIYVGLADYKVGTTGWTNPSELPNQIRLNRTYSNIYGQIHFRHAFLNANALKYRDSVRLRLYNKPALLPAMPWKDNVAPAPATALILTKNSATSVTLSWTKPAETVNELDKAKRFVIYRSTNQIINPEIATNILAITNMDENTYTDNSLIADSTYYYAVTSLDRLHNESGMTNIASNDNVRPVVITQNISRTLTNGSVSIAANEIDNGSSDNWGIASMTLSKTSFDCSNIGENTVTLSVTDKAGNIDSATAIVTIIGTLPEPIISITRTDTTFTSLPESTIALGYGAQSLIFTASSSTTSNGTTYSWSPATGLSSTNTANTTFTPTAAGTYTFTVVATNEFGCSATEIVTITVIDARCENDKVLVCKTTGSKSNPSNQICISANAVPAHLKNGGILGACSGETVTTTTGNVDSEPNTVSVLSAYPNPFTSQTTVTFTLAEKEKRVILEIYDLIGNRLSTVYQGEAEKNKTYSFPVDASNFQGQFFNVRLITPGKVYNFRLVKE
ncbi:MAG TPA: family 10 glycosylhydrolase [Sphingobacteriaceae bacterium]|nr:family 10 glycosylhydrolase [Sphingobacteriaceae bacterium]